MMIDEEAAKVLQRAWKGNFQLSTLHYIVKKLFLIDFTIDHMKTLRYEPLLAFLRKKSILSVNEVCLKRIYKLCLSRHGCLIPENINIIIKKFLACYMIVYHKTLFFDSIETLESSLYETSKVLLTSYQNICTIIITSANHSFHDVPNELSKTFATMFIEYLKYYKEWEVKDKVVIIHKLKNALFVLCKTQKNLLHNEPEDSNLQIVLRIQINQLKNTLKKYIGIELFNQFNEELHLKISSSQNEYDNTEQIELSAHIEQLRIFYNR